MQNLPTDVTIINEDVTIIAYYFKDKQHPKCFPKRMEYGNCRVTFTETGLRHPTHQGKRMVHVFDMTDGEADYRLEFDAESLRWKLVYIADQIEDNSRQQRTILNNLLAGEHMAADVPAGIPEGEAYPV